MANIPDDVRELQNYLRTIARYKKTIPLISIDEANSLYKENEKSKTIFEKIKKFIKGLSIRYG